MTAVADILRGAPAEPCRPWPRHVVSAEQWSALAALPLILLALWADGEHACALYEDPATHDIHPVAVPLDAGFYPALSPHHPGARLYERMVRDLWGAMAAGGDDGAWLDHGHWPGTRPLAARPGPRPPTADPPEFQPPERDTLMQWPIGPIGPGIGEAQHLRLTLDGTTIVRAESRLGYTHKGALALMRGKSPRTAARFAARLAGDATVAHAIAFAKAAEAAAATDAPPRAVALRGLMLRLERIAANLDALGIIAGIAGSPAAGQRCGVRQEYLRRGLDHAFGHRLMMDCVVPGGVAADGDPDGLAALYQILVALHADLPAIARPFGQSRLLVRLTGLGNTPQGDAARRCRHRLRAIERDTEAALERINDLPEGPLNAALPQESGEGLGKATTANGDVWHWLGLDHGQIAAAFARDPGWPLWPMAEAALTGSDAADAALILASFALPVSGMDL
jgi:Ni,Fe-hydrogenase III large subunit